MGVLIDAPATVALGCASSLPDSGSVTSISLNFELNDRDLEHFDAAMAKAKLAAEGRTPQEIIDCSVKLLADAQKVHIPDFIL